MQTRRRLWTLAAMLLATGVALGQTLPANHPPVGGGSMPAGHPPMGATSMPAGHPAMGGATMPAGPLPMDPTMFAPGGEGTDATQPALTGALNVTVVAGSAGGKLEPDEELTVELYHRGSRIKSLKLKLDAAGKATAADLPVMPPVQALVSVRHGGLLQQVITPELSPKSPTQTIQMKVFETTEEMPAWTVAMQHMIVEWLPDGSGAHVTEMISTSSPGDRAWLGDKVGEKRVTLTIALPENADNLELGGNFDEESSKVVAGKLVTSGALFPGRCEYRVGYTVPAKDGALELPVAPPATAGQVIVFVPADSTQVVARGLTGGAAVDMGQGKVRMFRAQNVLATANAGLSITGIKAGLAAGAMAAGEPAAATDSKFSARNLALGGAFLIVLLGVGMLLIKKPKPAEAKGK